MESHANKWLLKQYRYVLGRMRMHEYHLEHPQCVGRTLGTHGAVDRSSPGGDRRLTVERLEDRVMLATTVSGVPNWIEHGPAPMHGSQVKGITNQPVTGAIQSVVADPDAAQAGTIWV